MRATSVQRTVAGARPPRDCVIRAGVVGTGFMGYVHARAALATGAQVDVLGSAPARAREMADRLPGVHPVDGLAELLAGDVQVVHVCVPNADHARIARAVLDSGKHVVCEKPLATTAEEAAELAATAADRGLVAAVPFVYRYYPTVLTARDRIAADPDNRLWLLHGSYLQDWLSDDRDTNWRVDPGAGGGSRAFADIGVHWCDLMEFVTGQRITHLSARLVTAFPARGQAQDRRPVLTEDGGVVMFATDRGAVGSVVVSQVSAGRHNRLLFSFDGPKESYEFDQEHPEQLWVGDRQGARLLVRDPARMPRARLGESPLPAGHPEGYARNFENFVRDVYAAVRGEGSDTLPTFGDGARAARITAAVVESAPSQQWVEVPA